MDWDITIGGYMLAMLAGVEIHKSVDLLADTCIIRLPAFAANRAFRIEQQIKRSDKVIVRLGYNREKHPGGILPVEFEGYLLSINTDGGELTLQCEDELFLLRKAVTDKEFKNKGVKEIAQYLVNQTKSGLKVNCSLNIDYEKFVITKATAYDVLKKLQEETKANIYLKAGVLHIHPPYIEKFGDVLYTFQDNIEESDLKYQRKEDKKIEVVISSVGKDGKKKTVKYGTTGGQQINREVSGFSEASMKQLAQREYTLNWYDGYEGSITGWLIPFVEPGYTADVKDEDYEFKNGKYYVTAVTTSFDENGGVRKIQLGIKVG